jgi:hypothetical protein
MIGWPKIELYIEGPESNSRLGRPQPRPFAKEHGFPQSLLLCRFYPALRVRISGALGHHGSTCGDLVRDSPREVPHGPFDFIDQLRDQIDAGTEA